MRAEVNLVGLCCSVPQLIVYSKVKKMKENDVLEVVVERGSSQEQDVVMVIKKFGIDVVYTDEGDLRRYVIELPRARQKNLS